MGYEPIRVVKLLSGVGLPPTIRAPEAALQTFLDGTPLALAAGFTQESAFGGSELIYGFAGEHSHYLAVAGTAEDGHSEGAPTNQPHAVTVPVGSWVKDGKVQVWLATDDVVFRAKLLLGQVFTQALVIPSGRYKLVKDTDGYWYIDSTHTHTDDEDACEILGVDPASPNTVLNAAVFFRVAAACRVL